MGKVISCAPPDSRAIRKIAPEIHVWRHCPTHTSHCVCVCVCLCNTYTFVPALCGCLPLSAQHCYYPVAARHQFAIVTGIENTHKRGARA